MPSFIGIYVAVAVAAVVIALILVSMRGRGKLIECPECGARFGRPTFAQKHMGFGFSFSGLGDFTCPKCKYKARTTSFRYVGSEE